MVEGNNGFAVDLYRQLDKKEGNLFFSPYSISNALAMTYAGARGNTAKEMATAMHFNLESARFHPAFASLIRDLQGHKVLKQLGMKDAFLRGKADFSGMTTREKLFISHVVHKAFVDVNEAGTEAAASTAVVMAKKKTSLAPPGVFNADHPFVFLIRDARTGSILFMGRVADPK